MKLAKTILLVEDELDYREILQDLLSDSFDQVLTASNGEEALEKTASHHVDIIVCDVNMPHMPGDQFLRHLRAKGHFHPVIFLTGNADKDLSISVLRLGASDVLDKPCPFPVVLDTIQRVLELEKREKEMESMPEGEEKEKARKMIGLMKVVGDQKRKAV